MGNPNTINLPFIHVSIGGVVYTTYFFLTHNLFGGWFMIGLPSRSHFWMMFPLQPSFFGDFPLPPLITRGYTPLKKQLGSPPPQKKTTPEVNPRAPKKNINSASHATCLDVWQKTLATYLGWNSSRIIIPGMYLTCYIWLITPGTMV